MIVFSLLKCENKEIFYKSEIDNWYCHHFNDFLTGHNKQNDITMNKVNIINFNYDVSYPYHFIHYLSNQERISNDAISKKYVKDFYRTNHFHVYGHIHNENIENDYGKFYDKHANGLNSTEYFQMNTCRFIKAVESYTNIKTMHTDRELDIRFSEMIKSSKNIIFIGFGFDRDNLNMLGLPNDIKLYTTYFSPNQNWMILNYKGLNKSLENQFQKAGCNVTFSRADTITNAYIFDFKNYLY